MDGRHMRTYRRGIYAHSVIVHQENFVDEQDGDIHTENIENLWMRVKRKFRKMFGTSRALFNSYLQEFVWMINFPGNNNFGQFVACVQDIYPI